MFKVVCLIATNFDAAPAVLPFFEHPTQVMRNATSMVVLSATLLRGAFIFVNVIVKFRDLFKIRIIE
jgi:hypothetical protein